MTSSFSLSRTFELLERTPSVLQAWLSELSDEWILQNEGPDTWSPFDIIGHLIHGELTDWIDRAKASLENDKQTFEPFDRYAQFETSKGKSMQQLLDEFEKLRKENLAKIRGWNLSEEDLEKRGIHPELGEVNLQQLLATWLVHDQSHIAQIARVMAKQYKDEVGPWKEYIPLVNK